MPAAAPAKSSPAPPRWSSFTINPESRYADDEQEAEMLAHVSATELTGYLFALRLLEIAKREGKNPLIRDARAFTPKQLVELEEAITEARNVAEWMQAEIKCAFGMNAAERIREYTERRLDAEVRYTPDPQQQDLF